LLSIIYNKVALLSKIFPRLKTKMSLIDTDYITKMLEKATLKTEDTNIILEKKIVKTEDTGKMFEMAICLTYGIKYDCKYKYDMELPKALQNRLIKLPELFPQCTHSAKCGARYDFTAIDDTSKHLSAKTIKKGIGKVAPQVIGQAQPHKFCEKLNIPYTTVNDLKIYIQANITTILPYLVSYTFDCPNLYYHQKNDTIMFIEMVKDIEWDKMVYEWTKIGDKWNNSSTLKIKMPLPLSLPLTYVETECKPFNGAKLTVSSGFKGLVEFQFHTTSRSNMAIRWYYDNVLDIFKDNFSITLL
jgi:hypothetical protein